MSENEVPNTTPEYNDGLWHGWNGGECPVHPRSEIEVLAIGPEMKSSRLRVREASMVYWSEGDSPADHSIVAAFRVIEEYKEPREFWLGFSLSVHMTKGGADDSFGRAVPRTIHVREVTQ